MPYADEADKKRWYREAMDDGYGKRIYARRKLHHMNTIKFRETLDEVVSVCENKFIEPELKLEQILAITTGVLRVVDEQEEILKGWKRSST